VSFEEALTALSGLALRLRRDPRYMACALAAYREQEGMSEEELADELNTLPELVVRLALCKRPQPSSPNFAGEVRELANYTLANPARLAGILRQVDALEGLSEWVNATSVKSGGRTEAGEGLLAAARDRIEPVDSSPPCPEEGDEPDKD